MYRYNYRYGIIDTHMFRDSTDMKYLKYSNSKKQRVDCGCPGQEEAEMGIAVESV